MQTQSIRFGLWPLKKNKKTETERPQEHNRSIDLFKSSMQSIPDKIMLRKKKAQKTWQQRLQEEGIILSHGQSLRIWRYGERQFLVLGRATQSEIEAGGAFLDSSPHNSWHDNKIYIFPENTKLEDYIGRAEKEERGWDNDWITYKFTGGPHWPGFRAPLNDKPLQVISPDGKEVQSYDECVHIYFEDGVDEWGRPYRAGDAQYYRKIFPLTPEEAKEIRAMTTDPDEFNPAKYSLPKGSDCSSIRPEDIKQYGKHSFLILDDPVTRSDIEKGGAFIYMTYPEPHRSIQIFPENCKLMDGLARFKNVDVEKILGEKPAWEELPLWGIFDYRDINNDDRRLIFIETTGEERRSSNDTGIFITHSAECPGYKKVVFLTLEDVEKIKQNTFEDKPKDQSGKISQIVLLTLMAGTLGSRSDQNPA